LIEQRLIESMNRGARLDQRSFRLAQLEERQTDLHAGMLRILQNCIGTIIALLQQRNLCEHARSKRRARRSRGVASRARALLARAQHSVARFNYRVIAMTAGAAGNAHLREYLAVAALAEKICVHRVALTAYVNHRGNAGR